MEREIKGEVWKDVCGYEGLYQVSNMGFVKHLATRCGKGTGNYARKEHLVRQHKNNKGYYVVDLYRKNERKTMLVHRLVALAFVPNPMLMSVVNHKDETTDNNNADNLEWCSQKYNMNYGTIRQRIAKGNGKPVVQFDKERKIIRRYKSIMDAQRQTGIPNGSIGDCLHHRSKTAGGYLWDYEI